ncbi:hypothetical protein [Pararhizobium mangrovi]|uniref:Uncharacterized protein n=1 Tax=Pararhizobium mangrovi TaxID=2590452 RepID=A0A506U9Y8_9HYPH|nr:hypothetical protein [Pararhizobium mangrovi]TPW29884.1 hypothetical protein FJU11_06330 [Pararhizobium mangrovi]
MEFSFGAPERLGVLSGRELTVLRSILNKRAVGADEETDLAYRILSLLREGVSDEKALLDRLDG